MSPELLVNAAWAVTLWTAGAAAAVLLLGRAAAVVRRDACRLGLAGVPVVLLGSVLMHRWGPSAGLFLRPAEPAIAVGAHAPPARPVACSPAIPDAPVEASSPRPAEVLPPAASARRADAEPGSTAPVSIASAAARRPAPAPQAGRRAFALNWHAIILPAVLFVGGACAFLLVLRLVRLATWRRTWRPAPEEWVVQTRELARRVGMHRDFSIHIAPGLAQPAAMGVLHPAIVLPDRPPRALAPVLRHALAHELGHLAGRDPLWYVLGRLVAALAWWCPAAWWLHRRAQMESELAADDHALACGVRPIELAKTLARFAEWDLATAPAGISGMACHLTRRIEMILNGKQPHESRVDGRARWFLGLASCLVGLAVVAFPLVGVARGADEEGRDRPRVARDRPREGEEGGERSREGRRDGDRERGEGEGRRDGDREVERGRRDALISDRDFERILRVIGSFARRRRGEGSFRGEEGRSYLSRDVKAMADAVKATDGQRQALRDKLEAKEQALRKWEQDNQARVKALVESLQKVCQDLEALDAEHRKVAESADAGIVGVFTAEQRALWETSRIARMYTETRGEGGPRYTLTNAQLDDIDVLCEKAAKELLAAESKPQAEAEKAKREILYNLQKKIYEDVLKDDQRPRAPRPRGYPGREGEGERRREGLREGGVEGERREGAGDRERGERKEGARPDRDDEGEG